MVANPETVWMGLEYFCNESDALWRMSDADLIQLAKNELAKLGMVIPEDVLDGTGRLEAPMGQQPVVAQRDPEPGEQVEDSGYRQARPRERERRRRAAHH